MIAEQTVVIVLFLLVIACIIIMLALTAQKIKFWILLQKERDKTKEILEDIGNVPMGLSFDNDEMYAKDFDWYKELCKKYGVEVENDEAR